MAWPTTSRHERGYGTEHDRMRALLMRTIVLCEECARQGRQTPGTIADHKLSLALGGTGDRSNYQLLCRGCSDEKTLTDKGQAPRPAAGVDASGRPTDPSHPWNRKCSAKRPPPPGSKV